MYKLSLLFLCLLFTQLYLCGQDTNYYSIEYENDILAFSHDAEYEDEQLYDSVAYLLHSEPNENNHETYFLLAQALWELNKIDEAKLMFLNIISSTQSFYEDTYYHSSDIVNNTSQNSYGYGSFTANYKNKAAIYLTKIYIEQKNFDKALSYLEDAVNKYKVYYNCGTGHYMQEEEYHYLYGLCYEGLGEKDALLDLLLPSCFSFENHTLIRFLKKNYTKDEITKFLEEALQTIEFKVDEEKSYHWIIYHSGEEDEATVRSEGSYYAKGTMQLSGRTIHLPSISAEKKENLTKDYYLQEVKNTDFYQSFNDDVKSNWLNWSKH